MRGERLTLQELKEKLTREGIEMVVQRSEQGRAYGVIFVDFHSKSAFKGSDLGKQYSAKGLEERCSVPDEEIAKTTQVQKSGQTIHQKQSSTSIPTRKADPPSSPPFLPDWGYSHRESLWEALMKPEPQQDNIPYELTHEQKKKNRKLKH